LFKAEKLNQWLSNERYQEIRILKKGLALQPCAVLTRAVQSLLQEWNIELIIGNTMWAMLPSSGSSISLFLFRSFTHIVREEAFFRSINMLFRRFILAAFISFASTAPTTSSSQTSTSTKVADPSCTNGPFTRQCWGNGFSIATDYDAKWPVTGKTVPVREFLAFSLRQLTFQVPPRDNKHNFGSRWCSSSCNVRSVDLRDDGKSLIKVSGLSTASIQDPRSLPVSSMTGSPKQSSGHW
jgi:hypothetical protein